MAYNKDFIVKNGVQVLGSTQSTSTDSGALIVNGGAGIGGTVWAEQLRQTSDFVSIGKGAGGSLGWGTVAIGENAGQTLQGLGGGASVAIGQMAGRTQQGANAVAVGVDSAITNQGTGAVAVGQSAGEDTQGTNAVAIGLAAGATMQGAGSVAVGPNAGASTQGHEAIAIGGNAAEGWQGTTVVDFVSQIDATTYEVTSTSALSVGQRVVNDGAYFTVGPVIKSIVSATYITLTGSADIDPSGQAVTFTASQSSGGIAVGYYAGVNGQGYSALAVGQYAAQSGQGRYAVSLGYFTGDEVQGANAVAIGKFAGQTTQGASAIAIGNEAGKTSQGASAVAIGDSAGHTQGVLSIAIGSGAGYQQGGGDIAIGPGAGGNSQSGNGIAIGSNAGLTQGSGSIAIGSGAGSAGQGASAIAIGTNANSSAVQPANSIVFNANWTAIKATNAGLYIAPIRADATTSATTWSVYYNTVTKELTTASGYTTSTLVANAVSAITATSAAIAYSLANTSTTRVGFADTANNWLGGIVYNPVTFSNDVTFSGSATFINSTSTIYTDNILEIHTPSGGMDAEWTVDDGKDIGFHLHYFKNGTDTNAALLLRNDSKYLEWFQAGTDSTSNGNNFTATTYGTFKTGNIILANTTTSYSTTTGALTVAGGVGIGGALYVGGILSATNITIGGVAVVAGPFNGGTITNPLIVNNATASTSTTTGALTVAGGVGIQGDLFVGATGYVKGAEIVTTATFSETLGTALATVSFTATYITQNPALVLVPAVGTVTTYGTYNFGSLTDITTYSDYNTISQTGYYSVNDATGAPAHVEYIGFSNVTEFNRAVFNINYTTASGHTIDIDLYNYQTDGWDTFATFSGSGNWQQFALGLIDHIPYISAANSVTTRIYHLSSGNTSHRTWIDYVALEQSTTGGQGPRGATGATGATGAQGVNTGTTSTFIISNTAGTTSTTTGALQVAGGVGVGGGLFVGGIVTATVLRTLALEIALGGGAGLTSQGTYAVAIGTGAGQTTQSANAIAIGYTAGQNTQGGQAVAIGSNTGVNTQGVQAIAVGSNSGYNTQGDAAVAVGSAAGYTGQGVTAVAVGYSAGYTGQGVNAVSIGNSAGYANQGGYSVALGYSAGKGSQAAGSIIISATSTNFISTSTNQGLYITPIRPDATTSATTYSIYYNPITKELTTSSSMFALSITSTVTSTSTTTGALVVAGGVGISGNLYVGGTVTVGQPIICDPLAAAVGTSIIVLDSFDMTKYRAAKYFVSVSNGSTLQYQASEILLIQDGTNASIEQTSVFATSDNIVTFSAIIIGGIVYLRGIGTSANNAIKLQATYITV